MKTEAIRRLSEQIEELKRSNVKGVIDDRLMGFMELGEGSSFQLFKELCFCILTANFNAERSIRIQREIGDGFITLSESDLAVKLRQLGHRFPSSRARYIVDARRHVETLKDTLRSFSNITESREWLSKNVKGIGFKESSHFLRNIGYQNIAIVDFHIVEVLRRNGVIESQGSLNKDTYLQIETRLKEIAERSCLNLAELDLYLWYMETGKVLK